MRAMRSDKRLHSKHLFNVAIPLMRAASWRERLLGLTPGAQLVVDATALRGEKAEFARLIRRWGLRYTLTVDVDNQSHDPCPVPGAKVFRVQAARHPRVFGWVEELPEALGKSESEAGQLFRERFSNGRQRTETTA